MSDAQLANNQLVVATQKYVELQDQLDRAASKQDLKEYARLQPLVDEAKRDRGLLQQKAINK